jgi:DivIVA domain-containing protein
MGGRGAGTALTEDGVRTRELSAMAQSENREESPVRTGGGTEPGNATEQPGGPPKEGHRPTRRIRGSGLTPGERDRMLNGVRNINFPVGLRGYDRMAVDRYVEQVNRLIAELEISSSPESAVRHALDEVSEETRELLQRAQETADEITTRSRMRADERLEKFEAEATQLRETARQEAEEVRAAAEREAGELRQTAEREATELRETTAREVAELRQTAEREVTELRETTAREVAELRATVERETQQLRSLAEREADAARASARTEADEQLGTARREAEEKLSAARREADETLSSAEARAHELSRNAEAIWRERKRLIDDMRSVGEQLVAIGETESKRFQHFAENGGSAEPPAREGSEAKRSADQSEDEQSTAHASTPS